MSIKKILVPHDGEQMSDTAMMQAAELAKALAADIEILYVIDNVEIPPTIVLGNDHLLIQRAKASIARELEKKWNNFASGKLKLLLNDKVKASTAVRRGDPAEETVKYSKEIGADLIVIGSRRLKGASMIMVALGSVARKVSEHASCPVMIIH